MYTLRIFIKSSCCREDCRTKGLAPRLIRRNLWGACSKTCSSTTWKPPTVFSFKTDPLPKQSQDPIFSGFPGIVSHQAHVAMTHHATCDVKPAKCGEMMWVDTGCCFRGARVVCHMLNSMPKRRTNKLSFILGHFMNNSKRDHVIGRFQLIQKLSTWSSLWMPSFWLLTSWEHVEKQNDYIVMYLARTSQVEVVWLAC